VTKPFSADRIAALAREAALLGQDAARRGAHLRVVA
jgi:hypothetical protein